MDTTDFAKERHLHNQERLSEG